MCVGCNFYGEKEDGKMGCVAATEQEKESGCESMAQKTPGCGCNNGPNKFTPCSE